MQAHPTLLITSCITPPADIPFTSLLDAQRRVDLTLEGIEYWLKSTNVGIVICDGSGFDLSTAIKERFPQSDIECLHFTNSTEKVSRFGKGYGEGEIINFALDNSIKLRDSSFFIKCTSKYHVVNFSECMQYWNNNNFLCIADISFGVYSNQAFVTFIDTRFYIVNKNFYVEKFSQAYKNVDDKNHYYLEHAFKDIVSKEKMAEFLFPIIPTIEGTSGTTGIDAKIENAEEWRKIKSSQLSRAKATTNFVVR